MSFSRVKQVTLIKYSEGERTFKKWLKLVEGEQANCVIMKNIIINRLWLYYLWQNGYSPRDALKDVRDSIANLPAFSAPTE